MSLVLLCGGSALLLYSLLKHCWAMQLPGVIASFLVRRGREQHLAVGRAVNELSCLGRLGGSAPRSFPGVPIRLSGQEGPGVTLSSGPGYELALLPL